MEYASGIFAASVLSPHSSRARTQVAHKEVPDVVTELRRLDPSKADIHGYIQHIGCRALRSVAWMIRACPKLQVYFATDPSYTLSLPEAETNLD